MLGPAAIVLTRTDLFARFWQVPWILPPFSASSCRGRRQAAPVRPHLLRYRTPDDLSISFPSAPLARHYQPKGEKDCSREVQIVREEQRQDEMRNNQNLPEEQKSSAASFEERSRLVIM